MAYPTETHQFLLLCWKRPKKHLKLASHPLGWEDFTTCLQGSPAGQGRGRGVLLSLVGEQRTEPQSSCPSVWPRGRRQNILSLGPNDISSPGSATALYDVTRKLWWNYYCLFFLCPAIYYSVYFQELWETFITKPKPGENLSYLEFVMKSKHGLDFLKGSFGGLWQP